MLENLSAWLASTGASQWIGSATWVVPSVQSIHILAIAVVMASAVMFSLRVLGLAGTNLTLDQSANRFLPWLWWAIPVLAATGLVMIVGEPRRELLSTMFWTKMTLLVVALIATWAVQTSVARSAGGSDRKALGTAKAAALLSLIIWLAIIACGRLIAYVGLA